MRIRQLPPAVANQIAAGEVIERPASVVKELLENALDAGATAIHIEICHGGLNRIRVSDNGSGILAEDLPLAVAAHATSKIARLDDLYLLDSMGFRGEALASIASVSRLTLTSRTATEPMATSLEITPEGYKLSPAARNQGTTVDVADLFYNAPVRKNFLKNEKQEFIALDTIVKRFALSAPALAIQMKHNGKMVLSLAEARSEQTQLQRLAKIFGQAFVKEAAYFEAEHGAMHLSGWVSGTGCQRSQNDRQWVYINQRMVKDKLLNHAIKQAYEGILHPGRFPACLLYFRLDTRTVDVNVHPTKHEVRFQEPRLVHDFFSSQLSKVLKPPATVERPVLQADLPGEESAKYRLQESPPLFQRHAPWVILNSRYGLLLTAAKSCLVDMRAVYYTALLQRLRKQTLPLDSRPLLLPLRYALTEVHPEKIQSLQQALEPMGINIRQENNALQISTIPIALPALDLRGLLDFLLKADLPEGERMIACLCEYQFFDARQLGMEEKDEIYQMMEDVDAKDLPFCKELTVEDCQKWLESFV